MAHAPTSVVTQPRPGRLILPTIVDVGASDLIAETDRVNLRPWRLDEADRFVDMHRRTEVAQWIGGRPMADPSEAESLIQRMLERLAADPRFGAWAVVERATDIPAGTVLLKPLPDGAGEIEIGWHLHYHELSLMFWIGMRDGQQPTIGPDGPSPCLQLD